MFDDSFIWEPWPIVDVEDILRFEDMYRKLVECTPEEWDSEDGFIPHDFGDGSLCLMSKGNFKKTYEGVVARPKDVFIHWGCSPVESLVLHSFIGSESCLYRKDSYYCHIPPIVNELCRILDCALDKLPHNENNVLFRACVYEDRNDFSIGDIFAPGYSLTTSADESWQDKSVNRYIIKPLCPLSTQARAIYTVKNNANEYQQKLVS